MSLRQTEENCGLNPQGQREHLTASKHIYIVLHEQWTGLFRPPLTQQSMKHKEVAPGERAPQRSTQITSASSYRQCFVIQHEESHSWCITPGTWAALLQYVDDALGATIKSWCVASTSSTDVDRCRFCTDSHLNAPKRKAYQRNWSWTTGLINKVVMLEAFRWEIINITFIASRPVLFICWMIKNRWGN